MIQPGERLPHRAVNGCPVTATRCISTPATTMCACRRFMEPPPPNRNILFLYK